MERRFDMSDFEQSLKDHADQFNMVPSRRVWKGIYNNLHPGSKWPSITVAIVFIITLLIVGNLNNSPKQKTTDQVSEALSSKSVPGNTTVESRLANSGEPVETHQFTEEKEDFRSLSGEIERPESSIKAGPSLTLTDNNKNRVTPKHTPVPNSITFAPSKTGSNKNHYLVQKHKVAENNGVSRVNIDLSKSAISKNLQEYIGSVLPGSLQSRELSLPGNSNLQGPVFSFARFVTNDLSLVDINALPEDAGILEELDLNSLKKSNRRIKNVKWIFYVTPSMGSAIFRNKEMSPGISPGFSLSQSSSSNGMTYNAGVGLKTGTQITSNLSKKWDIITGLDLGYSGYNIVSNLVHPTFTTLLFKDNKGFDYSKRYITHFGNGMTQNKMSLSNYSLQVSVPLGVQYHIWQDKKAQVNLLTAIDLSTVLKSNAYIISSDGKYYVKDPSLARPVNMGLNFNPNIVFGSGKVKWHLGPSIRYQLLSRYKNNYVSKEHLIDYGIKVGISK